MADIDLSKATDAEIVKHLMGTKRINVYHYHTMINAIAALRAAWTPRWVPVEERLPEEGVEVAVLNCHGCADIATLGNDYWSNDNWHGDVPAGDEYITHWIPLPPAPKGGE